MDGPYRAPTTALTTTPARQLAKPLRRKLFFRQKGLAIVGGLAGYQSLMFALKLHDGNSPALIGSAACMAFLAFHFLQRARDHRRRMHTLAVGKVANGRVLDHESRRFWNGGPVLRVELEGGPVVEIKSPIRYEPGVRVRIAYEPGRSEHAFVLEDLPEPLRLDGDTWTAAELLPVPPPATPPPSPRS